jgi:hypothetical protein
MICPRAWVCASRSGMQETVWRTAGRARADPVFVGRLVPVAVHNLAAVIARGSGSGAFRLMVSPLFHGGKFPAAIGAAKFVGRWIYCRHGLIFSRLSRACYSGSVPVGSELSGRPYSHAPESIARRHPALPRRDSFAFPLGDRPLSLTSYQSGSTPNAFVRRATRFANFCGGVTFSRMAPSNGPCTPSPSTGRSIL